MALDPLTAVVDLFNGVGQKVIERIWPDPAQAAQAKLELAKLQATGELQKLISDNDLTKAFLEDTASARVRDIEFLKAGKRNVRGDFLAYMAIGALIGTILLLFVFPVPEPSRELLLVVLGALIAIIKDVYGFEFGSSKDSQRNAQAVTDILKSQ